MLVEARTKRINHLRGPVKVLARRVRSCDADPFAVVATTSLLAAWRLGERILDHRGDVASDTLHHPT
jgi:hypothetical protein